MVDLPVPEPKPYIARFEAMGYGLFMHWGLYSVLERGEWALTNGPIPAEEYATLPGRFTAEKFDGHAIGRFAADAGMKYAVLTTRHHDGFSLYDTRGLNDYDAPHSAAGRDLVADYVEGCRAHGIVPFFYHTTLDWRWGSDQCDDSKFDEYLDYLQQSVEILCTQYGPIGGLWFDGNWSRPLADWKEGRLYEMIRRHQPDAIIVNNTGLHHQGQTGHPEIDCVTYERGLPTAPDRRGWQKYVAGEMCLTMNQHWGIAANDFKYLSPADLITTLADCRKVGANLLLNIGLTAEGAVPYYDEAAIRKTGEWFALHAQALRNARPGDIRARGRDFVLQHGDRAYYFAYDLNVIGSHDVVVGGGGSNGARALEQLHRPMKSIRWMDNGESLRFTQDVDSGLAVIDCTGYRYGRHLVVRVAEIELA